MRTRLKEIMEHLRELLTEPLIPDWLFLTVALAAFVLGAAVHRLICG